MVVPKPKEGTREEEEEFGFRHPEFKVLAGPPKGHVLSYLGLGLWLRGSLQDHKDGEHE